MPSKDKAKLPKNKICKGEVKPQYPHVLVKRDALGNMDLFYSNPEEHKKFIHQNLKASGSYNTTEADDDSKEMHTALNPGEVRGYVAGGKSAQIDGHNDINGECTIRTESHGDNYTAIGKDRGIGYKGKEVKMGGSAAKIRTGSKAVERNMATDTVARTYDEDYFKEVKGDQVYAIGKTRVDITKKDHAINVGQNFDIYVKEKAKVETGDVFKTQSGSDTDMKSDAKFSITSKDDMTLESDAKIDIKSKSEITITADTKITIKVGSSTIEISSSGIKINASGVIDIQGSTTKIQGGGLTAPPTTFS